jgi:hypothetical protein
MTVAANAPRNRYEPASTRPGDGVNRLRMSKARIAE